MAWRTRKVPLAAAALLAWSCQSAPGAGDRQHSVERATPSLRPSVPPTAAAGAEGVEPSAQPHPNADTAAAPISTQPTAAEPTLQQPVVDPTTTVLALDASHSTSLGAPSHGSLVGGVALPDAGPGYVHNPKRPDEARYGTVELVQNIVKAAAVVQRELPGMELVVNDLGLRNGGPIRQHGSHQSGRDADILFYVLDAKGEPLRSVGVPLDPDGKGFDFKDVSVPGDDIPVRLDVKRTWRFIQALLESAGDAVQRIFIVEHVRSMLLAHAERVHAPSLIRARFADITCQPESPHDDHFHVRLFCAPDDIAHGCFDSPPVYPWQRDALAALGLKAVFERIASRHQRREEVAERTTSSVEARKRTGPMHAKVRKFLARRATWDKQPHPGRLFCR
jgi:penicillin-insensitive murein endopeptidase